MPHTFERAKESDGLGVEFKRLKNHVSTDDGYEEVNDAWMRAMNYYKRDGHWFKADFRGGDVAGFAIDPVTWEYEIGPAGSHHEMPRLDLHLRLTRNLETSEQDDKIRTRIVDGRLAKIDGWEYPLVFIVGGFTPEKIQEIESKILELKIGLPLRGIREERRQEQ